MHKKISYSLLLFFTLQCIINNAKAQVDFVEGKWNGGVSMVQTYVGITGTSTLRLDATIRDNVVSATMNFRGEAKIGTRTSVTTCYGAGPGELHHLSIDREDSTFHIHVIGTDFTCTPKDEAPGQDAVDISFTDKIGGNFKSLVGSRTDVTEIPNTMKVTTTYQWSLYSGPLDAELIVTPVGYDTWLPKATPDELRKGSVMDIKLNVQGQNGRNSSLKAVRFELRLSNTSKEPGTTLNTPLVPSTSPLPDIRFVPHAIGESINEDQFIEIPCTDGKTGTATIASYDGGGWTTLTAVAVLQGGIRIEGMLLRPGGVKEIPIPKRDPASHIGTTWLTANGNPGEMDDKEKKAPNPNIGDGLTAYEEYRGVISEGQFKRLKPADKELGVMVKRAEAGLFKNGISLFETASGVKVIRFDETEINPDRRLNKNFLTSHDYDQYVLKVEDGPVPGSGVGMNEPIRRLRGIPKQSDRIVIDIQKIKDNYQYDTAAGRAGNEVVPYTYQEKLDNTVAHEIGHGVNLIHHGDEMGPYSTVAPNCTPTNPCYTTYRIYDHHNNEILNRPIPLSNAGAVGSEESGDLSCIMAYTGMYQWAYRLIQGEHCYYYVTFQPVGKKLCTSTAGTGINANNKYFGNGEDGNCLNEIKLR